MAIGSLLCPACKTPQAPTKFSLHTQSCVAWRLLGWAPLPPFKFDPWKSPSHWVETAVEGVDYLRCRLCAEYGLDFRFGRLKQHVEIHGLTVEQYQARFPGALVNLQSTSEKRKATNKAIYGVESPVANAEVAARTKAKNLVKYGVEHASQTPEALARRAQTNIERYGAANPFESKVIQQKAKDTMVAKYGVENAQQVEEIKNRTAATNLERYGSTVFCNSEEARSSAWWAERSVRRDGREADRRDQLLQAPHEICKFCGEIFQKVTSRHKAICEGWTSPEVEPCLCGHVASTLTSMKQNHRPHCQVWNTRDEDAVASVRRARTCMKRFGVSHVTHLPEVQDKIRATNQTRYGAPSPFSRGASTFNKVQASLKGRRFRFAKGSLDNPFARPEVQAKSRATRFERYGVEHASQLPEFREKAKQTNLEKYGTENPMQSAGVQARARKTNLGRYGHEAAAASEEVKAKVVTTNMERYGVRSTAAIPKFRRKQYDAHLANWGGHFFSSTVFPAREKIIRSCLAKVGKVFPKVEVPAASEADLMERYGVLHPKQDREYTLYFLHEIGEKFKRGPNGFESKVQALAPQLLYTGNRAFWRWLPRLGKHKNPDFLLPGPDPEHPFRDVTRVVECFGTWFHGQRLTGQDPKVHEAETISAYAEVGLECLVVWEHDLKDDPEAVRRRVQGFVGKNQRA